MQCCLPPKCVQSADLLGRGNLRAIAEMLEEKGKKNTGNQQGQWQCDNNFGHTAFLAEEVFPHRTLSDQNQNASICVSPVTQLNYVSSSKACAGQEERERQKELWLFSVNTGSAVALWTVLRGSGCDTGQSRQLFHCDNELVGKSATSLIQFFLKRLSTQSHQQPFSKSYRLETKLFTFSKEN